MDILDIVQEVLRARLSDPRSSPRGETSDSDSFTASVGQTEFTLTPTVSGDKVQSITSMTVDAATQSKWEDYEIDVPNSTVTLNTAASGGEAVVVNYRTGTNNWIYPDNPRKDLDALTAFPRISVERVTETGRRTGSYSASIYTTLHMRVGIWTKKNQVFTISSNNYEGHKLAEYLLNVVEEVFAEHEDDFYPILSNFIKVVKMVLPFDENNQVFHGVIEFTMDGDSIHDRR